MTNQPKTDKMEMVVTLTNGTVQAFRLSDTDRVYAKGSTLYWSKAQWEAASARMIAAGATIQDIAL